MHRYLSAPPRATTGAASGLGASVGSVSAIVDSRGAATQVVFDYGPTPAYGSTAIVNIPAALSAAPVTSVLSGLAPGTTYHVRVRAINEEGSAAGGDMTFATTALPVTVPPVATLSAEAHFSWGFLGSRTVLRKATVSKLKGGETIKVTCSSKSKGCKFKSKTYKKVKKGTKSFASLFGRKRPLKTGAKVVVRVTFPGAVGSSTTLTVGKRKKDPKIKHAKVNP